MHGVILLAAGSEKGWEIKLMTKILEPIGKAMLFECRFMLLQMWKRSMHM